METLIQFRRSIRKIRERPDAAAARHGLRPDIQGLRAFAVLAVILDHLVGWPSGGFVGVDVFFVISGFVITASLLREYEKSGRISFSGFYRRRIKRILPASTLTLLVTVVAAFFLFGPARFAITVTDSLWALFFSANWHFAAAGTDYFQAGGPISPLQHFWSLAVEEQFYFVWPWLLLAIYAGVTKRGRSIRVARNTAGITILLVGALSLVWALTDTATTPTVAYFSTLSRAWELGVGALLAVVAPWAAHLPSAMRPFLAWIGATGMVLSLFLISNSSPFPAPAALLPVASASLFIFAGTGTPALLGLAPFTNPVSRYLGDISYSLYLWHFPIIIFAESVFQDHGAAFIAIVAVLIFIVAAYAYHLVEDPIRKSEWLTAKSRSRAKHSVTQKYKLTALSFLSLVTLATTSMALLVHPSTPDIVAAPVPLADTTVVDTTPTGQLAVRIQAALVAPDWPDFEPAIANMADQRVPQWTENGCLDVTPANIDSCVYGVADSQKTVVVLGDSIATSWLPAVIGALEPAGYRIQAITKQSCPFALTEVYANQNSTAPYDACASHKEWAADVLTRIDPELIIVSDSAHSIRRLVSKATGLHAQAEWKEAYSQALSRLPESSKVVALMTPPGAKDLQQCYTPLSKPSDCTAPVSADWETLRAAESAAATEGNAIFVDTKPWFCFQNVCPAFAGNSAIFADTGHLTGTFSAELGPVLSQALKQSGVPL